MDCRDVKSSLQLVVGDLRPDDKIMNHLESCSDCRKYYEELQQLEGTMQAIKYEPLSAVEFAMVQEKLDSRIGRLVNKAVGMYRLMVRYGTSVAAICLLLFISLVSDIQISQNVVIDDYTSYQQYAYQDYAGNTTDEEDSYLEEDYVDALFSEYVGNHGSYAGQQLLGELSEDEYEYLSQNIDVGDML